MVRALVWEKPADYEAGDLDQDGLWKKVIGELFEDFLLFFAPTLHAQVDFSKAPDFLQQELFQEIMDEKKGRRMADQLVKVYLVDGEEKWILVHVEVQSDNEKDFAKRMFQYFYRIYDRFDREIVALAIMTSPHQSEFSTQFRYSYFGTKLDYAYTNYKVADYDYKELEQSDKLFSKVVLATKYMNETKQDADKRYAFKMKLMREIIKHPIYSRTTIQAVFYFIDYLLRLPQELSEQLAKIIRPILKEEANDMVQFNEENPSPTLAAIFAMEREEGERKGIEQGIERGIEQGIEQGIAKVVLEMLKEGASIDFIAKVTHLDKEAIEKIRKMN
ncbi:Rpn family recombination-promoting nuclease/putative transposase [Sporosarcina sp. E16_8]|uniref:Rpn family recombination-promoting nuclease/putative transposase n=1 Tax=Sporosarcina sp. E16_8 TaxID=2789295 RepID=UPI001A920026|nr:Rpn family recombination-promoting nuclease/putative transposase [Sporosarcina sp. E16_8]MBO0588617.1 Rpn family recombination-promoting nuclease/putative transposase [Sporosarcina sp. E16_8]